MHSRASNDSKLIGFPPQPVVTSKKKNEVAALRGHYVEVITARVSNDSLYNDDVDLKSQCNPFGSVNRDYCMLFMG